MTYQITNLIHCHVPEGLSIVTATMRYSACTRESQMLLNADWTSSLLSDVASHGTDHLNDGEDEEYENRKKCPGEYRTHAAGSGQQLSRGDMRFRKRTRVPWLESDGLRLLAYRKDMDME
ncbi:hypothetical protein K469DRAFT_683414 [Zopfia rhizophila CBS 207.26]|uniref:Uncharacterized protein n=1 Tax=Zopfia rhizophila CBS 207.26 TaxID=1314779 RepID=A0A6A6D8K8_9PEZI|nr:hypothetical protein K469DRAFT_683414 [Zopfia rhizophila CBS 207.26]